MGVPEEVLAAFQVEHREHLDGIRGHVAALEEGDGADIDEMFRMAHSLKGGARICGLTEIESLSHALESLFAQVRTEKRALDASAIEVIHAAMDAVEGYMVALGGGGKTEDLAETISAVKTLVDGEVAIKPADQRSDLQNQLLNAFEQEQREYGQVLRQMLQRCEDGGCLSADDLADAYRFAHSLKGGACVAGLVEVSDVALKLESLMDELSQGQRELGQSERHAIACAVDAIEEGVAAAMVNQPPAKTSEAVLELDNVLVGKMREDIDNVTSELAPANVGEISGTPVPSASGDSDSKLGLEESVAVAEKSSHLRRSTEMLRVSVSHIDNLMLATDELLVEGLQSDVLRAEVKKLRHSVETLAREWSNVRLGSAARLHQLSATPGYARLARFLDLVDHESKTLVRQTQRLELLQQRSTRSLERLGKQVQQSIAGVRMVTAGTVLTGLGQMVRDLARDEGKEVSFRSSGFDLEADRAVLQALKDPLMHVLRNAVNHGLETPEERGIAGKSRQGRISLAIRVLGPNMEVAIEDDGRGFDLESIREQVIAQGILSRDEARNQSADELARHAMAPGLSTAPGVGQLSGRGMGLSVVAESVRQMQGQVSLQRGATGGTCITITVPVSLASHALLMVESGQQIFALPVHAVERLVHLQVDSLSRIGSKPVVNLDGRPITLLSLSEFLGIGRSQTHSGRRLHVVILTLGKQQLAVAVDNLIEQRWAIIKPIAGEAGKLPWYNGACLAENGKIILVISPGALFDHVGDRAFAGVVIESDSSAADIDEDRDQVILVVDDSFTTRTLEKSILESVGYRVILAVDGQEALSILKSQSVDLIISDIEMPRMDGFELVSQVKADPNLGSLPVILVTSLDRPEDKRRGLEAGAEAYIIKRRFDHQELLGTIRQFL